MGNAYCKSMELRGSCFEAAYFQLFSVSTRGQYDDQMV